MASEVKMPCNCYPKAKMIQNHVSKRNNCPSFVILHTEETSMVEVDSHGQCKNLDCGVRYADYGLGIKDELSCKTQTKCGLPTVVNVFY